MHDRFDVIVVGSGATGGWAAKELCENGLNVLMLEAGYANRSELLAQAPQANDQTVQSQCYAYNQRTQQYFIDDEEHPYSAPTDKPYTWIRTQIAGGKSMLWGGQAYRMSDFNFKAASLDNYGEDWPLGYQDIAPYYDKVEAFMGVIGTQEHLPQLPDGRFTPAAPITSKDAYHIRAAVERLGLRLIVGRIAAKATDNDSEACIHCGQVGKGCIHYTSSTNSTVRAAKQTGRLTFRSQSLVRHVITNETGTATGVYVIDKQTGQGYEVNGRVLFLCASALESTRILLNSASEKHPNGLANASGLLGHYLMDHIYGIDVSAYFTSNDRFLNTSSVRPRLFCIPRWQNLDNVTHPQFLRGYSYQVYLAQLQHALNARPIICHNPPPADHVLSEKAQKLFKNKMALVLHGSGEMLPRYENYVEIDKTGKVDAWDIPVLKIHLQHRENEKAIIKDMLATASKIATAAGATIVKKQKTPMTPGLCMHESGTCRMGTDPQKSILNAYNQCHDVPNLFVTDGSAFTSQGTQHPTLTMMALTVRACEYAIAQLQQGAI